MSTHPGVYPIPWACPQVHSRCQLRVVDQVLQRVTTAELIQQTREVADDRRRVWGVDVARNIPNLNQRRVAIGIRSIGCGDL